MESAGHPAPSATILTRYWKQFLQHCLTIGNSIFYTTQPEESAIVNGISMGGARESYIFLGNKIIIGVIEPSAIVYDTE